MIGNISSKAIALGGVSVLIAGLVASGTVVTEALLFKIKEAGAAVEAARAETEKARAEMRAADAARLDAQNKLLGAIEARNGVTIAAELMARSQRDSANINGRALVAATEVDKHADNGFFDNLTGPMIAEPLRKTAFLNDQIVRLKREADSGIDHNTRRPLSESERADRMAQLLIAEEEHATVQESSSKNLSDIVNFAMNAIGNGTSGLGNAYPSINVPPPPPRRIVEDK